MTTIEIKLAEKIQAMNENVVTTNIIIPILKQLNFVQVEFNGGTHEEGKDIICWEKDNLDNIRLITAQVKHFKLTKTASSNQSINTVVNQIVQCFTKSVPYQNKKFYKPYEAYLISTYPIESDILSNRFSEELILYDKKVRIIDIHRLIELLIKYKPDLIKEIIGNELHIGNTFKNKLNNRDLLIALGSKENFNISTIYTDIDFSIGKQTTKLFFSENYCPRIIESLITFEDWELLYPILVDDEVFDLSDILSNETSIINSQFISLKKKKEKLTQKIKLAQESSKELSLLINELLEDETTKKNLNSRLTLSKKINSTEKKYHKQLKFELNELNSKLTLYDDLQRKKEKLRLQVLKFTDDIPRQELVIEINGIKLANKLQNCRDEICFEINELNETKFNSNKLKTFLDKSFKIFKQTQSILSQKSLRISVFSESTKTLRLNFEKTRLKLSIDKIFNTGLNVVVLGNAGAGKTTSLQMHAINNIENEDNIVIWSPISKVLESWTDLRKLPTEEKIQNLHLGICDYLNANGIEISLKDFESYLNNRKVTILLDSIDEAIKGNEWLINSINYISEKYQKQLQIITSSRVSGNYLDKINYIPITLLPFTDSQRNEFVSKWFNNSEKEYVENILYHLANNEEINEITRNPLLITTLCVLAKNNIDLPRTEIKLYNDRLKLLTGYYDSVKKIQTRINSIPQDLELLARKLAFHLHEKQLRSLSMEKLKTVSQQIMKNTMDSNKSLIALEELIDPCNILVPMNEMGEFGFGHLRYQEHLSATELSSNRSINVEIFLLNNWWHDTLMLFAQMIDSLDWLINQIGYNTTESDTKEILLKMIENRTGEEKKYLYKLLNKYEEEIKQFGLLDYDQ